MRRRGGEASEAGAREAAAPAVDVLMCHDWPSGIVSCSADHNGRTRPIGNEPCRVLLDQIRPSLMVCGHMHTPFRTTVGETLIRCVGKVPSTHALAVFEAVPTGTAKRLRVTELEAAALPAPYFAEASDNESDDGQEGTPN